MIEELKECPNGHGPLKKIRGKQRCETCGWQSPRHERRAAEKEQHCKEESDGVTGQDVIKQQIDKYKKAVKYIDGCDNFDFNAFKEANRIGGLYQEAQESEVQDLWSKASDGGLDNDGIRRATRRNFINQVEKLQEVLDLTERVQEIDKKKQEEKCFIATACYGSELCPEIIALCRFRDKQLNATAWGRAFIRTYYRLSPILADVVRKLPIIRTILRRCIIKPILTLIQRYEANTGHPPT